MRTLSRRFGAGIAALALALMAAPAAQAEPEQTELKVEAAFDKPSYSAGALVTLRLSISNIGTVAAVKAVVVTDGGNFYPSSWGELAHNAGALIEPGVTRTFEVTSYLYNPTDNVSIKGRVFSPSVRPVYDPQFDLRSEVRATTGGWTGVVYGDRNENNQVDPGEPLGGTKVRMAGGVPYSSFETTTGPDGGFAFPRIPTGQYSSSMIAPDGWVTPYERFAIDEGAPLQSVIRAVRPLTDRLSASITLSKDSYQPGENVQATVTLTNRGSTPITGLKAWCNRVGNDNSMNNSPAWGLLNWDTPGLTVAAGESKTVTVVDSLPTKAHDWGEVVVACDFGPDGSGDGNPEARDSARVPGQMGSADVNVTHGGTPVAGVVVLLVDPYTKRIVSHQTSDANGKFHVRNRQAGRYEVIVLGSKWKLQYPGATIQLWASNGIEWINMVPR
ncbi:hypothetical protein JOF56_011489 [Kibdelosporangium banguiense]|uniref:Alpha-amylase n=1 Tax=Kibdelosporangium banguiense TaxID=1365924 RepID=A0ABS4U4H2_9PSEU|nr:hypothetical protein [Kibdelosporangium banguiense]MBP2331104.1 hypothetical protein [Kibdelosporangium banguiense]